MPSFGGPLFIGLCLEGFSFGLYSGIFAMYLQNQTSSKDTDETVTTRKHTLFYPICILYALSVAVVFCDIYQVKFAGATGKGVAALVLRLDYISTTLVGCCDFLSQSILIYRCWIVWNRKILILIIPSILAFSFLATWLADEGSYFLISNRFQGRTFWGYTVYLTSLVISLTVNALVTGLIVFKIFKVYQEVKPSLYNGPTLGTSRHRATEGTPRSKLLPIMFILIESGMVMFVVQLVRVVMIIVPKNSVPANFVIGINEMLFGITPTIIIVRVSMGLSYHDENSMVEATASMCFASDNPTLIPAMESITFAVQPEEERDNIGLQRLDDDSQIDHI